MIKHYRVVLRSRWDYAKVANRGKSYAAQDGVEMSEMVGKLSTHLMEDLPTGKEASIWSLFPLLCDVEKPVGGGYIFDDCYLDKNWQDHAISRSCNCYARLSYKYRARDSDCLTGYDVQSHLRGVGSFLDSAFYKNQPWFLRSLASM